jgi:uncharacterized OB-fold protein
VARASITPPRERKAAWRRFRPRGARRKMTLYRCTSCGKLAVTQPAFCGCGNRKWLPATVSGKGKIYSCTTLYAAAEPFEKDLPFQIAIIELEGGVRLTGRILGARVDIGDDVALVEERGGVHFFSAA